MPPGIWNLINYPILIHVPDKHYSVQLGWLTHFIKNVTCLSSPWLIPFLTSGMEQSVPLLPPEGIGGTDGKMGHSKKKNQAYTAHHDFPCFGISLNNLYMLAVPHCCSESQFQRRMFNWLFMPRTKWRRAILGYILFYNNYSDKSQHNLKNKQTKSHVWCPFVSFGSILGQVK